MQASIKKGYQQHRKRTIESVIKNRAWSNQESSLLFSLGSYC